MRGGELTIGPVPEDQHLDAAALLLHSLGMIEADLLEMYAAAFTRPDIRVHAVWDGPLMIAAGWVFLHGDAALLAGAATRRGHRHRGAHTALIATRAEAARDAGAAWLLAHTTGTAAHGTLHRAGLALTHSHRDWLWSTGS
ncbi:hypothetical protein [Catenuloplanes atrovinosus]|uniref:GNAT superfamily N-acetyltransferase n=1 Tax=Catenuloplanes atrovinosus TaxID=137266 RepID=A0AAE4CB18_9ACTN|nr:hypothetical protein [Catenuloplanes atrovinosus]MDR7275160.1 GNAT superfamily N-acetyltransferase [Catenuloplanes atrovinosus]